VYQPLGQDDKPRSENFTWNALIHYLFMSHSHESRLLVTWSG